MNNMYKLLTLLLMALLATGCEQMPEVLGDFDDDNDSVASMVLSEPVFSNDYKTMVVEGRLKSGTNTVSINNPKEVKISITETVSLIAQVTGVCRERCFQVHEATRRATPRLGGPHLVACTS